MPGIDDQLAAIRLKLLSLEQPDGEITVDAGFACRSGNLVRIRIRRRGRRCDLTDDRGVVSRVGKPPGWLDQVERVVTADGFNVNRRETIVVPAVHGRDIASLALRLAETSRTAYLTLLEMADVQAGGARREKRGPGRIPPRATRRQLAPQRPSR